MSLRFVLFYFVITVVSSMLDQVNIDGDICVKDLKSAKMFAQGRAVKSDRNHWAFFPLSASSIRPRPIWPDLPRSKVIDLGSKLIKSYSTLGHKVGTPRKVVKLYTKCFKIGTVNQEIISEN